ncbi:MULTISPECIES: JmjC domain-containing protein [unclassified Kitasatospora]|uniref:JmjC domain-containing protein n=1 Tax=unclassified Kitasatospora TaxID=2633591 RepID=UPI0009EC6C41|nr:MULTISPECIES: cupin domain-containing protein [unclassified Kitasatospora]
MLNGDHVATSTPSGLAELIDDAQPFLRDHWRRRPAVLRSGPLPTGSLTLDEADAALSAGALHSPYVEMVRTDRIIPREAYCTSRTVNRVDYPGYADATRIRALLQAGTTLVLRCVEQWHAGTAEFTHRLGEDLGRKVEAFFFVTPPGAQGLRLHRDDADVFVVQLNGSKQWYVHQGPDAPEWRPGPASDSEPPVASPLLRAGEVLYIPRGFAHYATGDSGLSVHLSLTVRDIATTDLQRAAQQLLFDAAPANRRPLDDGSLLADARAMLDQLTVRLPTLTPDQLLTAARTAQRAEALTQRSPGLTALADSLETSPHEAGADSGHGGS